ncbi:MAG: hypothetical protein KGH61_03865 [Candidatus Micrarchaeota archaeon]|nr:hypothetical protein [Candidatus Micrarchaeota archaeon]MDE1848058.1 hypothetical protein [Candidatus Micrarchaeota archaeon]MDE1864624.1 hypothetical protein [Candidatus Micrarchaeota archaeon]
MAKKKASPVQRRLEMLRKTQEITSIVERGNIEEQALSDSAGTQGVADEEHIIDLLSSSEDEEEKSKSRSSSKSSKKKLQKKPAKKMKRKRR